MSYEIKEIKSQTKDKICMMVSFNGGKDEYYEIDSKDLTAEVIDKHLSAVADKAAVDNVVKETVSFEIKDGKATEVK